MELKNEFTVPVPPARAWAVLTDIEGIAPCMPGAQLQEVEGNEYRGIVKVKVGPITAQYKGAASIEEQDEAKGHMVIKASGRDTRGQGNASALITVSLVGKGDGTAVSVDTDLTISGKVAQFGRGMLGDVSGKLLDQFVVCLEGKLDELGAGADAKATDEIDAESDAAPVETAAASAAAVVDSPPSASNGTTAPQPPVRKIEAPEAKAVDLGDAAGAAVVKRALPIIVVLLLLVLLGRRRRNS